MRMTASNTATLPFLSRQRPTTWTVVGDPGDNRVALFASACEVAGVPSNVVDYRELLRDLSVLDQLEAGTALRLESPGRAADLNAALISRGGREVPAVLPRGMIFSPDHWYAGYADLLISMYQAVGSRVVWTSHPEDVVLFFDKPRCQQSLQDAGIPVARRLGNFKSYDELKTLMLDAGVHRVFVKLRNGSAASGLVALRTSRTKTQAVTTVELADNGLFNTRRVRTLTNERKVAATIDALCTHSVFAEEWVPKAGIDGCTFDLRILVIAGEPRHMVVRKSRSTLTNLHLLNDRDSAAALQSRMSEQAWLSLLDICRKVARCFPRTLHLGLDVAMLPGLRSHRVLEVNAFGDLLKGITHEGLDTYSAELNAVQEGWSGE